jgi:hypothetical protein
MSVVRHIVPMVRQQGRRKHNRYFPHLRTLESKFLPATLALVQIMYEKFNEDTSRQD